MNVLELKEYTKKHVVYLYQPEGRGDWGEVAYDFFSQTAKIKKRAGENSSWHDNKALSKIEEVAKGKELPLSFIQAWY